MKTLIAIAAALLPIAAYASPVRIALRPAAVVQPDTADQFSLGEVADLTGGTAAERAKLANVCVGRAPLPDETREITPGDLSLKLRQAGYVPGRDATVGGALEAAITIGAAAAASTPLAAPPASARNPAGTTAGQGTPPNAAAPSTPIIHPGASVTIRVDDGALTITTVGIAETAGAAGDVIRLHRSGNDAEMTATVIDSQTVELEQ